MIIDSLVNSEKYISLHPHFAKAFQFIKEQNFEELEAGKFEISGKELNGAVSIKEGTDKDIARFEAHDFHIDIQLVLSNTETFGWKPRHECNDIKVAYNPEKDVTFFNDEPSTYFQLQPGQFVILYPEDVHAPMIGNGPIKKMVIKVSI